MTDATAQNTPAPSGKSLLSLDQRTRRRNASERRFRLYGAVAICLSIAALVMLLTSVIGNGASAFFQTYAKIELTLDPAELDPEGNRNPDEMGKVTTLRYGNLMKAAFPASLQAAGISTEGISDTEIGDMLSKEAPAQLRDRVLSDPDMLGESVEFWALANGRIDGYIKGRVSMTSAERDSNVSPAQLQLADRMREAGLLTTRFNWDFITFPDASELRPEAAGLGVAIVGSAYMMLIVLFLALPIGVAASIYLEEFAPQNRFTDLIEVNISNLAAVPSIVFGILGLAVFINYAGLPASAPIVGGLVLTLMTLPTIIISTRAALKAVPPSIRSAALGVGASKMQTVFHHVLPLAMPGILTGTILGLAQALGETAPLLLIGMVAFVRDYPSWPIDGFFEPASALPVQVYNFTTRGDPAFVERASGAIIVLLVFLLCMNLLAIYLRRKFERRW
ncbi:phosphate ABC transporter permease PstA [Paracoccus sp. R12_1]|uniref:phosphate ABC transporter permease PstA n=1 Tax=unclassified Paracoccus (in: a-proteobacteria) TaxID=2688777 RepID=UPI000C0A19CD|nr:MULTISPECIES: phosphate ABC transporter permease PstA [unclassified Paracoccus (in: a-proteobacteria)]MBO9453913.1 phosphate ABC transporter permease PstA [Paracoccus sp. R12_2]MBO9485739.1 phosphate ABC transporter permease PstA [Paracoccus sp. R12_1]PHQ70461.1 MAG: phosphate ABC transporter, permease protein PstA [Paracoccus sp. (in: a-proteobacteria)]